MVPLLWVLSSFSSSLLSDHFVCLSTRSATCSSIQSAAPSLVCSANPLWFHCSLISLVWSSSSTTAPSLVWSAPPTVVFATNSGLVSLNLGPEGGRSGAAVVFASSQQTHLTKSFYHREEDVFWTLFLLSISFWTCSRNWWRWSRT